MTRKANPGQSGQHTHSALTKYMSLPGVRLQPGRRDPEELPEDCEGVRWPDAHLQELWNQVRPAIAINRQILQLRQADITAIYRQILQL